MLPSEFVERPRQLCPAHLLREASESFAAPKVVAFRVNPRKAQREPTLTALAVAGIEYRALKWAHTAGLAAVTCPASRRQAASPGHRYIQGLSSMLVALHLRPTASDWLLDLAAAPGGKTVLMAEQINNCGKISAVEPVKARFFRLSANLTRNGVTNTSTYMKDGRAVGRLKPANFDKVLLDAPCSSEARFRKHDGTTTKHWSLRKVSECAQKQRRLILSGFDALKPGGTMLYCTCSFSPEENELVIDHLLKKRRGATLLPLPPKLGKVRGGVTSRQGKNLAHCATTQRIWPTRHMDGFFWLS